MRKFIKRIIGGLCIMSTLLGTVAPVLATGVNSVSSSGKLIEESDTPLRLHYDEEAPYVGDGVAEYTKKPNSPDDGWEKWSLPIGNGYFGANVFGRTESERIQITEKTLSNPYYKTSPQGQSLSLGGLNNFSETYLDIGHPFASVSNYERWLDLKTAIAGTKYDYEGVTYTREVFTSYPDKVLVIRLDASEDGKIDFTLRPTFPWKQEYATWEGDTASKDGQVISYVDGSDGIVELTGHMGFYDVDFMGIYRVVADGGVVSASTAANEYGGTDGTIKVTGADSAYIYVVLGSDYELTEEMFTTGDKQKPTFSTDLEYTRAKIEAEDKALQDKLAGKSYDEAYATLKNAHLADYTEIFGRVTLDLGDAEDAALTTDALLAKYKTGDYSKYLDMLYFQYGRYLLIASSRAGTLVSNLQGTWNRYNKAPWGSGIWHNINVQMNYWPAFSTNIAETFESYVGYNKAYMKAAEQYATNNVKTYNPSQLGMDGGNGWCIGTGAFPYSIAGDRSAGNLGFTTQLFWEYYQYTQDKTLLETVVFPVLVSAARYIVKSVELTEDGYYLVSDSDSPEMHVDGVWLRTVGTTYAQSFSYQNNYNAILAAKELGIDLSDSEAISSDDLCVFKRVMEQIDKYDPINVGLSGQVKEFRQEDYYCSMGDEPHHRHISQLVGLYPGNIINDTTPVWLDAAKVTLEYRGDDAGGWGWGFAHRMNLWARVKDGDRAYKLYNDLLTKCTLTNLWDYGTLFQIDGNLGGTAGVSEMLLQSHAGYIAPLAAIPDDWADGSYTGLVARGNFEVAAEWKNGVATCFNITSKVGGDASVSYGGITSAKVVRASDGKAVNYTVSGTDLITFPTEVGETYIISGFKLTEKLPAPASLVANRMGMGETVLEWTEVEGAVGYRVYTAIENQADYTLMGFTSELGAVYIPKSENLNARTTFKVVPLNADGVEGAGVIAYQNPVEIDAVIEDYEANAFDNGELQITVKATDNTQTYKLWKKAEGETEYTLVTESPYPIIICDGYKESDSYALTVVSKYLRTESELFVLPAVRKASEGSDENAAKWHTNLLLGTTVAPIDSEAAAKVHPGSQKGTYGYDKLTDGIYGYDENGSANVHVGRFSSNGDIGTYMDGVITLDTACMLSELRIYDFGTASGTRIGDVIKVYVMDGGEWKEVYSISGKDGITAALQLDSSVGRYYFSIDLGCITAEKLRVRTENNLDTNCTTIYEITCSGAAVPSEGVYRDNVLLGKSPTSYKNTTDHGKNYDIYKLTDGIFAHKEGRFALQNGIGNYVTVEYALDGECFLDELRIYDFVEASDAVSRISGVTIELYQDGQWVKVADNAPMLPQSKRLSDSHGKYTAFSLKGEAATRIRINMVNNASELGLTVYEIELSGYSKPVYEDAESNILTGKQFTPAAGTQIWSKDYGYDKLTDGLYNRDASGAYNLHAGRFSSKSSVGAYMDGSMWLGDVYALDELRLYDFEVATRMGSRIEVYAYYAGEWGKVWSIEGRDAINAAKLTDSKNGITYLPIDLTGVKAEAIRVYAVCEDKNDVITIYEITCSGTKLSELYGYNILANCVSATTKAAAYDKSLYSDNLLSGKTFTADSAATAMLVGSSYGYAKLTDGIYDKDANGTKNIHLGRFAAKTVVGAYMDGTIELGKACVLDELRMYDFGWTSATRMGDAITVYARSGGVWYTVAELSGIPAITAARKYDDARGLYYLPVDMCGIKADAIRVYAVNNTDDQGVTTFEITCSGYNTTAEEGNILKGKEIVPGTGATAIHSASYGYGKLTDGLYNRDASGAWNVHAGRFSTKSAINACLDGTVELGGIYQLSQLRIYDYLGADTNRIGNEIIIYARLNGEWRTVATLYGDENVKAARIQDAALGLYYLPFDLSDVKADAIRIHTKDTLTSNGITLYEITCSGTKLAEEKTVTLTDAEIIAITDKNTDTVYTAGVGDSSYTIEFDLGQNYSLYTLNIRDRRSASDRVDGKLATRSNDTFVELYVNGQWVKVADGVSLSLTEEYTSFELYGLAASKVRIGFNNTQTFDNGTSPAVVISDTFLSVCGAAADKKPLLNAYSALPIIMGGGAEYDAKMQTFHGYATEFMLNTHKAEEYAAEINAYNATLLDGTHTAHNILKHEAKAPTCTEKGYYAYEECTLCDYTTYESILQLSHAPSDGWESDENGHYNACGNGCGEKLNYAEHGYANATDTTCDTCGYVRELTATEGAVSKKIFWAFEDGVLSITGRGKIKNFSANTAPWSHLADQVTKVVIGEGITYIGNSAFFNFASIESVELPSTLTAIGRYTFYGCAALKNVTIPEAVTEIGAYAFRRSGLETIDFAIGYGWSAGDKVFNITEIAAGGHRFISKSYYKLDWVRNTEAEAEELPSNYVDGGIMHTDVLWTVTTLENGKLKLTISGNGMMADYGTACAPWYGYWEQIVEIEVCEGVTSVGRCAFYGLKFVRKATLADTVTAIGDYGFYMCRLMKEITIPEGVTSIGKDAFTKTGVTV